MKTPGWLTLVFFLCALHVDLVSSSNPYFFLYDTNCAEESGDLECCGDNPPINPYDLEIDFFTLRLDNATKPWQLDALVKWTPLTTDYLEYAVQFQPVVTLDELSTYDNGYLTEQRQFCLEKYEMRSNSCTDEPFFDIITNTTSLYVQDILFGFPYKFEIQVITNGSAQLKYYCFNSCYDIFPKTVAPDCFEETEDEEYCKNYPVPISGSPSNVQIHTTCVGPEDVGWTVDITWDPPVNVNGDVTHYVIVATRFISVTTEAQTYSRVYLNVNTTQLETIRNGSHTYTIVPFDDFHQGRALLSDNQYALDIYPFVRLPESYNISNLVLGARATHVLRTYEGDWCPTTQKVTTPKMTTLDNMTTAEKTTKAKPMSSTTRAPLLTGSTDESNARDIIIFSAVTVIATFVLCTFIALVYRVRCYTGKEVTDQQQPSFIPRNGDRDYTFKEPEVGIEFKSKEVIDRGTIDVDVAPLGRGQYGYVYLGTVIGFKGKSGKTTVAIKSPKPDASVALKEDFLDEIKLMIEIGDHPHIMPILGCCTTREPFYLITEYMKYGALDAFLLCCKLKENIDIDNIYDVEELNQVQIAWQISKGMSYLATTKYFHGDLAARNCLVGEQLLVKVSDFGLSDDIYQRGYKRIAAEKKRPVKWYSPEANLDGVCSTKGDVWSFGVVVWEIYTFGGIPYAGMRAADVVARTKAGYRMPQPEGCPVDIYKVIEECWQESPKDRPSFSEIEYALEVILAHRAEISICQPSGEYEESPYLPVTENDGSKMIRRDSSLADKINLYEILGSSADSAFHDMSNTSADSFTTDYQFVGNNMRVEPIIEEEFDGPRDDKRYSTISLQSNPDFIGNGSAKTIDET